jgi:hypothetical protein
MTLLWTQGAIELVGGLLLAIGLFTRPVAFILAGDMAVAYFMRTRPRISFRCSTAVMLQSFTVSSSCYFSLLAPVGGVLTGLGQRLVRYLMTDLHFCAVAASTSGHRAQEFAALQYLDAFEWPRVLVRQVGSVPFGHRYRPAAVHRVSVQGEGIPAIRALNE